MENKGQKKRGHRTHQPTARSFKVQARYSSNSHWDADTVPEITLCGKWLQKIGFKEGHHAVVYASKELIVIRPEESTED